MNELWQPTFAGLDLGRGGAPDGALVKAARATLADLDSRGLLDASHALTCQLVLELAAVVAAGTRGGRASAVAMAAKELREALATLPTVEAAAGDFEKFAAALLADDGTSPGG